MRKTYPVLGHSMRFALEPGDAVEAEPCPPGELKAGELALLVKWEGSRPGGYVVHRVLLNLELAGRRLLLTKGDANLLPDLPPRAFQPVGRASAGAGGPGSLWPLLALYSYAAGRLLSFCAFLAYCLLRALAALPSPCRPAVNALALRWEAALYPGLLALLAAPVRPAPGPDRRVRSGRLAADETWSGEITVADYLVVPPGVRVTVLPGTRIVFARKEPWFFPVLRAGDKLRELDSRLAKVLVYGAFVAEGGPASPVVLEGEAFGGLHALGGGSVRLDGCALKGSGGAALSAWDSSLVSARRCAFLSCARGAEAFGSGALSLDSCSFTAPAGPAARACDEASLLLSRCGIEACGAPAVELSGSAAAGLSGLCVSGGAGGLSLSGRASALLKSCAFSGTAKGCALLSGRASLRAERCAFSGPGFGFSSSGASRAEFDGCSFSGHAGQAAETGPGSLFSAASCAFSGSGAGLAARGRTRLRLDSCSFSGNRGPAVRLYGPADLRVRGCSFEGGESGIEGTGRLRAGIDRSSFRAIGGPALRLERPALLAASALTVSDCRAGLVLSGAAAAGCRGLNAGDTEGPALLAEDCPDLRVMDSGFSGRAAGAVLSGSTSAVLAGCSFDGSAGQGCSVSGRARASLSGCSFSGGGLKLSGSAEASAEDCRFSGQAGPAAQACGDASLSLRSCSFCSRVAAAAWDRARLDLAGVSAVSGGGPALSVSGRASLACSGCDVSAVSDAVCVAGSAAALLEHGRFASASGAALNLRSGLAAAAGCELNGRGGVLAAGGELRLESSRVSASAYGIDCSAAVLVRGTSVRGGAEGGARLAGPGRVRGLSVEDAPYPGISAGAAVSVSGAVYNGRPWTRPAAPARRPAARRLLFSFAAATAGLPVFSAVYRLIYSAAARLAPALLGVRGLRAVYLYRGMTERGWVPGLSDMDLAFVLDALPPAEDRRAYAGLKARLSGFRRLFPFTGETLVASSGELEAFLPAWGVKGEEFRRTARLLAGSPVPAAPAAAGPGDETEAFYSYTLLMRHLFESGAPENFLRRNCLKNLVDIRRYLDTASPERGSRRAYSRAEGLPLDGYAGFARERSAFLAFSALHAASAGRARWRPAGEVTAEGRGWFNASAFETACRGLARRAGFAVGVALDSLYRVYVVLPDERAGDEEAFRRACAALAAARASEPALGASPLVVTAASFALLARLPYLNNPLLWADAAAVPAGSGPEDGGVRTFGLPGLPEPPGPAELRAAAVYAARHFRASWRSLWGEMPPHYFYTRVCGLELLLKTGRSPAFGDPAALRAELSAAGGEAPEWRAFLAGGAGAENYEYIAARAAALGRPADAA